MSTSEIAIQTRHQGHITCRLKINVGPSHLLFPFSVACLVFLGLVDDLVVVGLLFFALVLLAVVVALAGESLDLGLGRL
jgi:hypothetical protein